ncbi:MAG: GTP-binding protein [Treponema sp.]|nr:GTP-binding protein [Treponema sp.]
MADTRIPMTLVCGYLGAGKTTLLNAVLSNQHGYKVAVIVNDIGEINVDARLIADGAKITDTSSIVPLTNGCICCTLKSQLAQQIEDLIKTGRFDYIMIEASGVCEPMPIAQELELIKNGRLDNIVSVVDAARMVDEFGGGDALLKKDMQETDIESLLVQQIEFCSTLVINKKDLVSEDDLKRIRAVISKIHPHVRLIETERGTVPIEEILATDRFDFETVYTGAGWCLALEGADHDDEHDDAHEEEHTHHHKHEGDTGSDEDEYGISSFIYLRRRPFDREKLDALAARWPRSIIRCKGLMWLSDEPNMGLILESSGRQVVASYSGPWLATYPKAEQEQVLMQEPQLRKEWDDTVGDRMIKLCVIGHDMDRELICKEFDGALADV